MAKKDLYISIDIEADGPIPGEYSMISIGACVAGERSRDGYKPHNPDNTGIYIELKPISDNWNPEAQAVSGLTREHFQTNGEDPRSGMKRFVAWINQQCGEEYRPVFCGYPAGYDWLFTYWYLIKYTGKSPFGFSGMYDMKTAIAVKTENLWIKNVKRALPENIRGTRPHTHNPLDDARGQADLFNALQTWNPQQEKTT